MKVGHNRRTASIASIGALALVLAACGDGGANGGDGGENGTASNGELSSLSGNLTGSGASSFQLAMQEWAIGFPEVTDGAVVDYNAVGSGTGRAEFLANAVDFAGSDAVMDDEEYQQSTERCGPEGAFHIPTAVLPIAVAANLPGVDDLNLTPDAIAGIFAGDITNWNDEAIASLNEGAELPDTTITVIHRSDDSGTTENFTEYLADAAPGVWEWEADGSWPGEISAESADGTSGVVQAAVEQEGAVTYVDAGQVPGNLTIANVEVGGEFSELTPQAAGQAVAASELVEGQAPNNMAFDLDRDTQEVGAYPIVQVAYTIWCNEYADAETADLARGFAGYIVSEDAQQIAEEEAGASPLTPELRSQAEDSISQITAGA